MSNMQAHVHFEQEGSRLTAVEIVRGRRSPIITSLQRTLFALGIVVSSYQVRYQGRAKMPGLVERVAIERQDGGVVEGQLTGAVKAAILPIVLGEPESSVL
jgi:hypothetical protein